MSTGQQPNTPKPQVLGKLKTNRMTASVSAPSSGPTGDVATTFQPLTFKSKYSADITLLQVIEALKKKNSLETDLACRALILLADQFFLPSEITIGGTIVTKPTERESLHKLDLAKIVELVPGSENLPVTTHREVSDGEKYSVMALCLMAVRFSSYRANNLTLRELFQSKLYTLCASVFPLPNDLIGRINGTENYFVSAGISRELMFMTSIYDIVFIKDPAAYFSSLRICTISTYHRDNAVLLKYFTLTTTPSIDVMFTLKSIILDTTAREAEVILKHNESAVAVDSVIPYMRSCNLVQKSIFSATELPHMHVFLSTLLALFSDANLFASLFLRPDTEVDIVLAYLIFKEHNKSQVCGRFIIGEEETEAADMGRSKIENHSGRVSLLIDRFKNNPALEPGELEDLKRRSAPFADKPGSIAAHIKLMLPGTKQATSLNKPVVQLPEAPLSITNEARTTDLQKLLED